MKLLLEPSRIFQDARYDRISVKWFLKLRETGRATPTVPGMSWFFYLVNGKYIKWLRDLGTIILVGPYYIMVQSFYRATQLSLFERGLSVDDKILDRMTKRKIWDRDKRKFFTVFWDMAEFFMRIRNPIPSWWAPL